MTLTDAPIVLLEPEPSDRLQITAFFEQKGYRVIAVDPTVDRQTDFTALNPVIALFNGDAADAAGIIEQARAFFPEAVLMVMGSAEQMPRLFNRFRSRADDFITKPITPLTLKIIFHRYWPDVATKGARRRCVQKASVDRHQRLAEKIETERFVAVRQIVEKMSLFVSQLNRDVQGGIRFFNEMPYFVAIHNRDAKIMATNPIFTELLGNQLGKNSWDIYRGKLATRHACPVGKTLQNGIVSATKAVVQYRSGARVPVIVHTAPIYNNDGEIELILEVFAGTDEIERMAAEIKTTQQRYQQLFDAVPSFIVVLDRRYRITAANQRFRRVFGNPVGKHFFDMFISGKMDKKSSPIRKTLRDGHPHQSEMILIAQDGSHHNVLAWTSPIFTPAGKLVQILVIFLDVTELRDLQDNLSSLGMMMGTVSHSLKGSLTGLGAALYLIDTGFYRDQPAKIEEGLDVAQLMVERIRKLVFDILYYAKDRELELDQINVADFCTDVVQHIDQRVRGANIRFVIDYKDAAGRFEIDAGLLRSALVNLLENAIEACIEDPSDREHTIHFTSISGKNFVQFDIEDDGVGMGPEQVEHSFSPFYSTKGRSGTGLGLFITQKVIQKHGGTLKVDSDVGRGTRFQIRLPRSIAGVAR